MGWVKKRSGRRMRAGACVGVYACAATWLLTASSPTGAAESAPDRPIVTLRDFFAYACVREYARKHSFPLYDSSMGFAVELLDASAEVLGTVHAAATTFASGLRAPDLSDEEHGGVAVMALCLGESRSGRVEALSRASADGRAGPE